MTEETKAQEKLKAEPIMDPDAVGALSAGLMGRLLAAADQARLNYGTLASLIGVSRSRVTQFSEAVKNGDSINISAHCFLSIVRCTKRIEQQLEARVLPAASTKGKSQEEARQRLLQP